MATPDLINVLDPDGDYTDEESVVLKAMAQAPRDWHVAVIVEDLCLDHDTMEAVCECLAARGMVTRASLGSTFDFRGTPLQGVGDWVPTRAGWRLVDSVD